MTVFILALRIFSEGWPKLFVRSDRVFCFKLSEIANDLNKITVVVIVVAVIVFVHVVVPISTDEVNGNEYFAVTVIIISKSVVVVVIFAVAAAIL